VIGEALDRAVAARNDPAAAQRGDAEIEFGLQGGRDGAHGFGLVSRARRGIKRGHARLQRAMK